MDLLEQSFIKGDELTTRRIAGETLIVPVRGNVGDLDAIYTLNEVGSRIWQLIDGRATVRRIIETISAEYDVDEAEAGRDVVDLLGSMETVGLIRRAKGSES